MTERSAEKSRKALLQATLSEVHRYGFQGARVERILGQCGLTKGGMYHHFRGKNALGYALIDELLTDALRAKWLEPLEENDDPIAVVLDCMKQDLADQNVIALGSAMGHLAQEMAPLDEGFRERLEGLFDAWRDGLTLALKKGQRTAQIRGDINVGTVALFIISAYEGCVAQGKLGNGPTRLATGMDGLRAYLKTLRP